jgi:hypothetical protein
MGNEDQLSVIEALKFYLDSDAEEIFAKMDLQLKDGMHFQEREHQYQQFYFLKRNAQSLELYYRKYYKLNLSYGGEGSERYYFLDFNGSDRGKIDGEHRYFLRPEYVIIGFLVYKIIYNDRNFDLTSVSRLQSMILTDYEEMMEDIYRLLAKLRRTNATTLGNDKVKDIVLDALKEFKKLGWIIMEEDFFDVMPSFARLNKVYADYINNLEELIKN